MPDASRHPLRRCRPSVASAFPAPALLLLQGCGGGGAGVPDGSAAPATGLPAGYQPPPSPYQAPTAPDPNAFVLRPDAVAPYWVEALGNADYAGLADFYASFDGVVGYAFPEVMPRYYTGLDAEGWAPASPAVRAAFLEVFADLARIFDVTFAEVSDLEGFNVVAISQNDQTGLAGYAYFPMSNLAIGSDVLISNASDAPSRSGQTTNLDYELVVHELGHALGLKHPFEADGAAGTILPEAEDTSFWTAMTYTLRSDAFDGGFRDLDLMALAGIFGVNPGWNAGDDVYAFSARSGVFVLDGAGTDTISAAGRGEAARIDLRPEAQSHLGAQSPLITAPWQLTISAGSGIENAIGGAGPDVIVGNALANMLEGGGGDDRIFAGEGADLVRGGTGDDILDLSEVVQAQDTLRFETTPAANGADVVHGFVQGAAGDVVAFAPLAGATLLAVVTAARVPEAEVGGTILRLVQEGLDDAAALARALSDGGAFDALRIAEGSEALVLTASSQATGADQHLFHVMATAAGLGVESLARFVGNALDIDAWHGANFA